jgi:hypothetical protein
VIVNLNIMPGGYYSVSCETGILVAIMGKRNEFRTRQPHSGKSSSSCISVDRAHLGRFPTAFFLVRSTDSLQRKASDSHMTLTTLPCVIQDGMFPVEKQQADD